MSRDAVVIPEDLLPEQTRRGRDSPELRLYLEVALRALADLSSAQHRGDAVRWFRRAPDPSWPADSFARVATLLGANTEAVVPAVEKIIRGKRPRPRSVRRHLFHRGPSRAKA